MLSVATRIRSWASAHPAVFDGLLAAVVVALGATVVVLGTNRTPGRPLTRADLAAMVIVVLVVGGRRRWPRGALVAATGAALAYFAVVHKVHPLLLLVEGIAAYRMALYTDRRGTWRLAVGCGGALYLGMAALVQHGYWPPEVIPALTYFGMATAVGDATRSRRAYLAAAEERARRAEQTREEEAQRRVIQERLRIARELHDVIAHHIAVINVQAAAAEHVLDRQPQRVRPALRHIRQAGDTVLQELSSIIGVLRQSDDPDPDTEPTRGLARLPELLDAASAAGLAVDFRRTGQERELPAVVDLAAYRIVQEALTNAHKHGSGTARLVLSYQSGGIDLEIVNTVAAGRGGTGSGYGIVGMRERAAAAEGTLDAYDDPRAGFTVRAWLPAPSTKGSYT